MFYLIDLLGILFLGSIFTVFYLIEFLWLFAILGIIRYSYIKKVNKLVTELNCEIKYKEIQENIKTHIASKIIFVFQTIMIILMFICVTIGYVQRGDLFLYLFGFVVPILILLIIAVQQLNEIYKYSFCYKELMKQISQDENEVQIEENIQNIN